MPDFKVKPSLYSLPPELTDIIFAYSHSLDVALTAVIDHKQVADLRSVSQVCRRLRELTLPLVWARVQVFSVRQLGALHKLLKAAPRLASLIRSFRFGWDMDYDCSDEKLVAYKEGTALELAFCDRLALWSDLMNEPGARLRDSFGILLDGKSCDPPGAMPDWPRLREVGLSAYNWQAGKRGRGPDGKGEDRLIRNATQLTQCITEVVGKLTSIETFGWETPVMPMPRGVFDALARLNTLTDLRLMFSECRTNLSVVPFWELSGRLRALSVQFLKEGESGVADDPQTELAETDVTSIEGRVWQLVQGVRTQHVDSRVAEYRYHIAVACHTVIAAAKGGQLKRLEVQDDVLSVFAVREFLPCWLRIEDWGWSHHTRCNWRGAATYLRPFFAHASRRRDWLQMPSVGPALDRRITHRDIVALHLYYENEGKLEIWEPQAWYSHKCVFDLYLPWLVEDAKLCQEVLDTWNGIVERGEADKVKCPCKSCTRIYREESPNARDKISWRSLSPLEFETKLVPFDERWRLSA